MPASGEVGALGFARELGDTWHLPRGWESVPRIQRSGGAVGLGTLSALLTDRTEALAGVGR